MEKSTVVHICLKCPLIMFELWGMHFEAVLLSVPTLDISLAHC